MALFRDPAGAAAGADSPHRARADARAVWRQIELEEKRIVEQTAKAKLAWRRISQEHQALDERRAQFEASAELDFAPPDTRVRLNVGGSIYDTTAKVLCRDRFSVLAALCKREGAPAAAGADGTVFVERDGWLFRYVLLFLREMSLPDDVALLRELQTEAAFFRLGRLHAAIEARLSGKEARGAFRMLGHTSAKRRPRSADALRRGPAEAAVDELARSAPSSGSSGAAAAATAPVQPLDAPPDYRPGYAPQFDPRRRYGDVGYDRRYGPPGMAFDQGFGTGGYGFAPPPPQFGGPQFGGPQLGGPQFGGPRYGDAGYDSRRYYDEARGVGGYSHDRFGERPLASYGGGAGGYGYGGGPGYGYGPPPAPPMPHPGSMATSELPDPFGFSGTQKAQYRRASPARP